MQSIIRTCSHTCGYTWRSPLMARRASVCSRLFLLPLILLILVWLPSGCSSESSKELIKISEVQLRRLNAQTLTVTLEYDLEEKIELPLAYTEVLVFPLEPEVKLAGTLKPFERYAGSVTVSFPIPPGAGIDWAELSDPETCCTVSLKGILEGGGVERISNSVTVAPPELSESSSSESSSSES